MKKLLMMAALVGASLVLAGSAEAGLLPCHGIGRHCGLGWGDGYHAQCDCGHGLLGCRLFGHGHCGKCKTSGKGAVGTTTAYPAEETIAPDEVPTPAMQP